jgi:hypothetical protein
MNWRERVYQPPEERDLNPQEWERLKVEILKRDKYRCQRCSARVRSRWDGTAHHIKPRREGGSNLMHNLIWLCHPCHDWVEERTDYLTTADLIRNSMEDEASTPARVIGSRDTADTMRPDWHRYVYGSGRNPRL